jgi:Ca2+:H+ antiporter
MKERIWFLTMLVFMVVAAASHFAFPQAAVIFIASAGALVILSRYIGEATEQLSLHLGESMAGFVNVTLSNLAELIIVFAAVRAGLIELVQANIVGSIIGNLLLVMGFAIYFGCRKHGQLHLNAVAVAAYLKQLFLVLVAVSALSAFNGAMSPERQLGASYVIALLLVALYAWFFFHIRKSTKLNTIDAQAHQVQKHWSKVQSYLALLGAAAGAVCMSELMVGEIEPFSQSMGISPVLLGYIVLPMLGNLAEHYVAIESAMKQMPDLSMAISVGSASQVGLVVVPAAVLFGLITGHPVTLLFTGLPVYVLFVSFIAAYLTLHNNMWEIEEGVMLLAIYTILAVICGFAL